MMCNRNQKFRMFLWIYNFMIGFYGMEMLTFCNSTCNKRMVCYVVDNKNFTMCAKLL